MFPVHAHWQATPVSSLQKLTATAPGVLENYKSALAVLGAVRGEWENFQIVVQADDEAIARVEPILSDLTSGNARIVDENIHVFWENYVFVAHPSGNRRLQKLWWPDALIPAEIQADTSLAPRRSRVLWINIRVPEDAAPGIYAGQIQIRADSQMKAVPIRLRVEPRTLPAPTCRANVALYYDLLRDWYSKNARPLSDAEFADLKKSYYDFLLDYRLNAYDLPVAWDSGAAQNYLRDPRVLSVRTPPLDRPDFAIALNAFKTAKALKKAYYYWIDEPSPDQYDAVKTVTQKLRALCIAHCLTAHPNRALDGAVDIWCPNIGDYFGLGHIDFKGLAAERKKGRETWWYTMAWPRYPYPTWLLDDDAASVRAYGGLMARHGISGFVYSMVHGWGPKPLENLESFGGTNGDGTLIYPAAAINPKDLRPMPSIRLMLLRDALEDYELRRPFVSEQTVLLSKPKPTNARQIVPFSFKPIVDGYLSDASWSSQTKWPREFSRIPSEIAPASTNLWVAHYANTLFVAARCFLMPHALGEALKGEWFAVDLAPPEADVRWRFVVTPGGKGVVEKHTREGHFRIEGVHWKFAAHAEHDFYNVEMQIPLSDMALNNLFRFNALRQLNDTQLGIKYTLRAGSDVDDVTAMPLLELQKSRNSPLY